MTHPSLQSRVVHLDNAKHHGGTRATNTITLIVMHTTAGDSAMSSIDYLNTTTGKSASYHHVIDRDGTIYRMCPITQVAYHAGDSAWPNPRRYPPGNHTSVNTRSIGIAWANRNDGEALTPAQKESALWLCALYCRDDAIPVSQVVGHCEVSPGRKTDPTPAISMDDWRAELAAYLST
jgi:N-acetylmuramoyl-L-alanine amidase